jgi:hypothetical protein
LGIQEAGYGNEYGVSAQACDVIETVMKSRRSMIAVVACLHLLEVPLSYAWSCNLTMIGLSVQPQNLSAAQTSLDCDPGADEMGTTLTVGISQELRSETFPGANLQLLPYDISQAPPIPTQL